MARANAAMNAGAADGADDYARECDASWRAFRASDAAPRDGWEDDNLRGGKAGKAYAETLRATLVERGLLVPRPRSGLN